MEPKPNNAIDFEVVTPEQALEAGSPAEQPGRVPEDMDARFIVEQASPLQEEERLRAQTLVETLQDSPLLETQGKSIESAPTRSEGMSPSDFIRSWGGKQGKHVLAGGLAPSEKGAAQFFQAKRLGVKGVMLMVGMAGVAGAATILTSGFLAEAGIVGTLGLAGAWALPAVPAVIAVYLGARGIRNSMTERAFKKTFGKTLEEAGAQ